MSRLSRDRDSLVDHARVLMLAGFKTGVTAPDAATSAAWTVTYTTDDPANVANRAVTIADGDTVTDANHYEIIDEIEAALNAASVDARAVRTAVAALVAGDNIYDISLAATTQGANASALRHIGYTFTTDAVTLTADGTVTIADGDLTTAAEFIQFALESSAQLALLKADIGKVHLQAKRICDSKGFAGVAAVAALAAGSFTVTYTTDAVSSGVAAATTIADGNGTVSVAERNDVILEVKDQLNKTRADIATARTALNSWLVFADIA